MELPTRVSGCAWLATALAVTAVVLGSCAPRVTGVDDSYTAPEGTPSPDAQLVVWTDGAAASYFYNDKPPADPDGSDVLDSTKFVRRGTPGMIRGLIIDHTDASAYQLFRREGGGGVRRLAVFDAEHIRQWLGTQYELFGFTDPSPAAYAPPSYIARGTMEGVANSSSPLTNLAQLASPTIANLEVRAVWWPPTHSIKVSWKSMAGATRYLLQVYEFRSDLRTIGERLLSGTPAPLYDRQSTDLFVAFVPANVNLVFVGQTNIGITPFQERLMVYQNPYLVRVAAIDAQGRLIGLPLGDPDPITAFSQGQMGLQRAVDGPLEYRLYRLAATTALDTLRQAPGPGGGG